MMEKLQNLRQQARDLMTHPVAVAIAIASFAHGVILALPVPERTIQSEPEPTPKETVKITSLVGSAPPPKPKPKPSPTPKADKPSPKSKSKKLKPKPKAAAAAPAPAPAPAPSPSPGASPSPSPSPSGAGEGGEGTGGEGTGGEGGGLGNATQWDPNAEGAGLVATLTDLVLQKAEEGTNDLDAIKLYIEILPDRDKIKGDSGPNFIKDDGSLKEGSLGFLAFPVVGAADHYEELVKPAIAQTDFTVQDEELDYGGMPMYKAVRPNESGTGEDVFFISVVGVRSAGPLVVLWLEDPRG
ncbi:MAG: hypothetical protein AAGF75_01210 [Cyanobacteria bacterium P01_H01_bin.130]